MIESPPAPYRQDRAPWGWRDIGAAFLITMVALVAVFTVLSLLAGALDLPEEPQDEPLGAVILLVGQMLLDFAAVGAAAAFSLGKYGLRPAAWGLGWPPRLNPGWILAVLLLCFTALGAYAALTRSLGLEGLEPESNVPTDLFESRAVVPIALFLVLGVAPVCEEMFFRGFLFHGLWGRLGFWPAAALSGFVFSLIHVSGVELIGLVAPFTIIGMLLAWITRRTGSLWNAIAVHFSFNAIGLAGTFASGDNGTATVFPFDAAIDLARLLMQVVHR
jgi:membrane protease YdiL (CAAX protease family)